MQVSILPKEIIQCIAEHLDRKSLYQCRQVCKSLYYAISSFYFKEVNLSGKHKLFLESSCENYFYGKPLGEYVKSLIVRTSVDSIPVMKKEEFERLMVHLPNLESISFDDSDYNIIATFAYIMYLDAAPSTFLPSLKHIFIPKDTYFKYKVYTCYTNLCYRLREQLLTVSFYDLPIDSPNGHPTILSFLSEFKSLQNLTLCGPDDDESGVYLPAVLYSCPNLKSLNLIPSVNWIMHEPNAEINYNILSYPALEELSLEISDMTYSQLHYIQNYLPNLKKLVLNQPSSSWEEIYLDLSETQREELKDYWISLDYISLHGEASRSPRWDYLLNTVFGDHLIQLYEKGYDFYFKGELDLLTDTEGITIDNYEKRVILQLVYLDLKHLFMEETPWDRMATFFPLKTIDIISEKNDGEIDIREEDFQSLVKNKAQLSRISILSREQRFYLGPIISTDWFYEEFIDNEPLQVIKKKESMKMLLLYSVLLSTVFFQTINLTSNKVETIVISKCNTYDDTIDLRMFENLNRLELDLCGFINYTAHNFLVKFISNEKEEVFSCCPFIEEESIEFYDSKEEIDLVLYVLYTQLNQLTIRFSEKVLYSSKEGDIFSRI